MYSLAHPIFGLFVLFVYFFGGGLPTACLPTCQCRTCAISSRLLAALVALVAQLEARTALAIAREEHQASVARIVARSDNKRECEWEGVWCVCVCDCVRQHNVYRTKAVGSSRH